jgi:hypothetical protein
MNYLLDSHHQNTAKYKWSLSVLYQQRHHQEFDPCNKRKQDWEWHITPTKLSIYSLKNTYFKYIFMLHRMFFFFYITTLSRRHLGNGHERSKYTILLRITQTAYIKYTWVVCNYITPWVKNRPRQNMLLTHIWRQEHKTTIKKRTRS